MHSRHSLDMSPMRLLLLLLLSLDELSDDEVRFLVVVVVVEARGKKEADGGKSLAGKGVGCVCGSLEGALVGLNRFNGTRVG